MSNDDVDATRFTSPDTLEAHLSVLEAQLDVAELLYHENKDEPKPWTADGGGDAFAQLAAVMYARMIPLATAMNAGGGGGGGGGGDGDGDGEFEAEEGVPARQQCSIVVSSAADPLPRRPSRRPLTPGSHWTAVEDAKVDAAMRALGLSLRQRLSRTQAQRILDAMGSKRTVHALRGRIKRRGALLQQRELMES